MLILSDQISLRVFCYFIKTVIHVSRLYSVKRPKTPLTVAVKESKLMNCISFKLNGGLSGRMINSLYVKTNATYVFQL